MSEPADFRPAGDLSATLVFVRHGESTYVAEGRFQGRHDPPLSELGERQARLVAARLADPFAGAPVPLPTGPLAGIWSSPLRRATRTAELIASAQPAPRDVTPCPELIEIAQGEWEGHLLADVRARWPAELAAWRRRPTEAHAPGGEPLHDAARRVQTGLASIDEQLVAATRAKPGEAPSPDRAGAAASRDRDPVPGYLSSRPADAARDPWAILVAHDGILRLALLSLLGLPLERFWAVPFNLCALTVVGLHDGVATLRAHNLADHLAPLGVEQRAAEEARGERRGAL